MRQRKDVDVEALVADYRAGMGTAEIADRHRLSAQTVRNRLVEAGVQLRPRSDEKDLPMDQVAAEYRRGDSLPVLGRRYGVHPETIRRRLMRHGEPIRDPVAGCGPATAAMATWLGSPRTSVSVSSGHGTCC